MPQLCTFNNGTADALNFTWCGETLAEKGPAIWVQSISFAADFRAQDEFIFQAM